MLPETGHIVDPGFNEPYPGVSNWAIDQLFSLSHMCMSALSSPSAAWTRGRLQFLAACWGSLTVRGDVVWCKLALVVIRWYARFICRRSAICDYNCVLYGQAEKEWWEFELPA